MPRWLRLSLVVLGLALTAGAGYRARLNDMQRATDHVAAQTADLVTQQALEDLLDLRASLHAFVAPGQGGFWFTRSTSLIERLRAGITTLEPAVVRAGGTFADTVGTLAKLTAAEKRAARYADSGQALLAGDVIFTEGRDLTEVLRTRFTDARQVVARDAARREAAIFDDQLLTAAVALGTWVLIALALVPVPKSVELPVAVALAPPLALHAYDTDIPSVEETALAADKSSAAIARAARSTRVAREEPVAMPDLLPPLATLCRDLGAMSDASQLSALLAGAAAVMQARGLVVWLASDEGLVPTIAHGYDVTQLAQGGPVPFDIGTITTSAYRDGEPRATDASAHELAALAVPVVSAAGVVGVLSAELNAEQSLPTAIALATIVAAQLATLVTPPADAESAVPEQHAQA